MEEKKEYVMLWLSYECYFEPYSDAEVGRLVRAMMKYKSSGEEPEFSGNERYVWPAIKRDIDLATAAQAERSRKNSINGSKRGQAKKANAFFEIENKQTLPNTSELSQGKGQGESKGQSKGKEDDGARTRESASVVFTPAVAFYRDRVAGPTASPRTLEELQCFENDLGSDVCIRAMMVALEQGKPQWNFILGILKNKQRDGIRSLAAWDAHEAEREARKKGRNGKQQSDSGSGAIAEQYGVKPDYDL